MIFSHIINFMFTLRKFHKGEGVERVLYVLIVIYSDAKGLITEIFNTATPKLQTSYYGILNKTF